MKANIFRWLYVKCRRPASAAWRQRQASQQREQESLSFVVYNIADALDARLRSLDIKQTLKSCTSKGS